VRQLVKFEDGYEPCVVVTTKSSQFPSRPLATLTEFLGRLCEKIRNITRIQRIPGQWTLEDLDFLEMKDEEAAQALVCAMV